MLGHEPDVLGPGDGPEDGRLLVLVGDALAGQKGGAAVGKLDDHWGLDVTGGLGREKG